MVAVRFIQSVSPFQAGQIVTLPVAEARKHLDAGQAVACLPKRRGFMAQLIRKES